MRDQRNPTPCANTAQACWNCGTAATHLRLPERPRISIAAYCELCAREAAARTHGEVEASLTILVRVVDELAGAGLTDDEVLAAVRHVLEHREGPHGPRDVPEPVVPDWAACDFEHDTHWVPLEAREAGER